MMIHVLLGGLIGATFGSFILVVLLAVVSHFLLDMIPHWDGPIDFNHELFKIAYLVNFRRKPGLWVVSDFTISVLLIGLMFLEFNSWIVVVGAFAAAVPDIVKLGYLTKLKHNKWYRKHLLFHNNIQRQTNWKKGLAIQGLIIVALIVVLF